MDEWAEKSGKKSPAFGKPDEKIRGYSKEMHGRGRKNVVKSIPNAVKCGAGQPPPDGQIIPQTAPHGKGLK